MSSNSVWKQFPHPAEPSREDSSVKEGEKTIPFLRYDEIKLEGDTFITFYYTLIIDRHRATKKGRTKSCTTHDED